MRKLGAALIVLLVLWVGFLAIVYTEMRRPPEQFAQFVAKLPMPLFLVVPFETLWFQARGGTLHPGDAAPDFELRTVDGSHAVRLSSFHGLRPVVLVFGSYT